MSVGFADPISEVLEKLCAQSFALIMTGNFWVRFAKRDF